MNTYISDWDEGVDFLAPYILSIVKYKNEVLLMLCSKLVSAIKILAKLQQICFISIAPFDEGIS